MHTDADLRSSSYDPTVLLFKEDGPGSFRAGVGTLEMDLLNSIEFLVCHVPETSGICEN